MSRLLREYFFWGSVFVGSMLVLLLVYLVDHWLGWGLFPGR